MTIIAGNEVPAEFFDLKEGQYLSIAPDGSKSVGEYTGVALFILKNSHIPSQFLPSVLVGYPASPEFYESGKFWEAVKSDKQGLAHVALDEFCQIVNDASLLGSMPNRKIVAAVAELMRLKEEHDRALIALYEAPPGDGIGVC